MNKDNLILVILVLFFAIIQGCKTTASVVAEPSDKEFVTAEESIEEKKSVFQKLKEKDDLSTQEVISYYHQLKKDSSETYNFDNEQELNRYGYMLLQDGKVKNAIEIFKLLVSEFPNAANPYDSLAEAYFKDGNEELALINYEKTLQINPDNNYAIDQVTVLKDLELLVTDWGKEFFHFPLHFAEDIAYQGVEEVVFPRNWINPDSTDFWSYVFVWQLENKKAITAKELNDNLTLYFDGLLGGLSNVDSTKFKKSNIQLEQNLNPKDSADFIGTLEIFDGFATQEPLTLNGRVYSDYCEEKDEIIILFRFSPLSYEHPIWNKLRTVKVRDTVCEE